MAECSKDTSDANIPKRRDKNQAYYEIPVLSWKKQDGVILIQTFTAGGERDFFPIPWTEEAKVWPFCPTTLLKDGAHRIPAPSSPELPNGRIYLDQDFIEGSTGKTGAKMMGGGTKWPLALDEELFGEVLVPITAQSLLLTATEQIDEGEDGVPKTLNLLDERLAPQQDLHIVHGGRMEVKLTLVGAQLLGVQPDARLLLNAVKIIQEKKDPQRITIAWGVVAKCQAAIDAGNWNKFAEKSGTSLGMDEAKAAIAQVLLP